MISSQSSQGSSKALVGLEPEHKLETSRLCAARPDTRPTSSMMMDVMGLGAQTGCVLKTQAQNTAMIRAGARALCICCLRSVSVGPPCTACVTHGKPQQLHANNTCCGLQAPSDRPQSGDLLLVSCEAWTCQSRQVRHPHASHVCTHTAPPTPGP